MAQKRKDWKEEFIRQRDAYRVQEDEKMEQIQRLRTEKNQAFQPVKRDTDHLQTVISTVEEAGDVMHLSQNVVETFIDRIEVFNDERVKIHFTFEKCVGRLCRMSRSQNQCSKHSFSCKDMRFMVS